MGWSLKQVRRCFDLHMDIEVQEVEIEAEARALAERLSGDVSTQATPHDLWEWVVHEERGRGWVKALGPIDMVICGFSCRDMSVAHRRGRGLRGDSSNVYFAAVQMLRWVLALQPEADYVFECTVFQKKHPRDWAFVTHDLGVEPVILDAGTVGPVWRRRAFWASFRMLPLAPQQVPVQSVMEILPGGSLRRPARRWREKLPTIMASGWASWNQRDCIEARSGYDGRWVKGPLLVAEVERAMGFGTGCTAGAEIDGVLLTERERWHGLGNAIHAAVLNHVMVSVLLSRGVIHRSHEQLAQQAWTRLWDLTHQEYAGEHSLEGDGPSPNPNPDPNPTPAQRALEAAQRRLRDATGTGSSKVNKVRRPGKPAAYKGDMRSARQHGAPQQEAPTWASIQRNRDAKGVPVMHGLGRKLGAPRPQMRKGDSYWGFMDGMMSDLMVLSRSATTWAQYAGWYGVFEEWADIMQVDIGEASMSVLRGVLGRALVAMWHGGGYAASTLELFATAVAATLDDAGRGKIKDDGTIKRLLEGINRHLGNAVNKKLAIEGRHIRAIIEMQAPQRDGRCWTGDYASMQWFELTAAMVLGWAGYLRCQDIINLQLCDVTWEDGCASLLIRRAKADQRGVTTVTCVDSLVNGVEAPGADDICLLSFFVGYVTTFHGKRGVSRVGCTRQVPGKRAYDCPVCPFLFPMVTVRGVEPQKRLSDRLLRLRMKAACVRLEDAGVMAPGSTRNFSVISLRRGGNSVCAARGVREKVRTNHGRWGLAGAVRRGLTSESEYNSVLGRDGGAVLKALHADLNEPAPKKRRVGGAGAPKR